MRQPICGGSSDALNNAATEYNTIVARESNTWNATASSRRQTVAGNGIFHTLRVTLSSAPGGGGAYTFTIFKNASATALAVTITDPATTAVSFTEVAFTASDRIQIESSVTGSPSATPTAKWSLIYEDTDEFKRSLIIGGHDNPLNDTFTEFNYLSGGAHWATILVGSLGPESIVSTPGTLKNFYVALNSSPGVGNSYTFAVRVNKALAGPSVTISGTNNLGSDTTNTATVAAGDTVDIRCVPSSTPTVRTANWGICFEADEMGAALLLGGTTDNVSPTTTEYNYMHGTDHVFTTTESSFQVQGEMCFIKNLVVEVDSAPTAGNSIKFTVIKNGSATALTATIADAATTASDSANVVEVSDGDVISLELDPTNTPLSVYAGWGLTTFTLNPFPDSLKLVGHGI